MEIINVVDSNGNIKPNLRADIMRKAMQPKGLLQNKGGIYVGTGQYEDIQAGQAGDKYRIYKTVELYPANSTNEGTPLVVDLNETCGLKFGPISGSLISDHTIEITKLNAPAGVTANFILTSNGPEKAPTFQAFNVDMLADSSIPASKLGTDICDTTAKTSSDGSITISLTQDSTSNQIQVNSISLNYSALINNLNAYNVSSSLRKFKVENNILVIY